MPIAGAPQSDNEHGRHDELHQRTTKQGQRLPTEREHQVAGLVNRQIQTVEPAIVAGTAKADPAIDREDHGESRAPATLAHTTVAPASTNSSRNNDR